MSFTPLINSSGLLTKKNFQDFYKTLPLPTGSGIKSVSDISQLGTLIVNDKETVIVDNPLNGGLFMYMATPTSSGNRVVQDSQKRSWFSLNNDEVTPYWFGALGGTNDDTAAVRTWTSTGSLQLDTYFTVTDKTLLNYLRVTFGEGGLIYNGVKYPAGDVINTYLQLVVPDVFNTIYDAVSWMDVKRVTGAAGVDIIIKDGTYNITTAIKPKWADGNAITIRGNESNPNNVVLNLDNRNNNDCFLFTNGVGISWMNGFRIQGTTGWISMGEWNDQCYGAGIRASGGCNVVVGKNVYIDKVYYGIRSMQGSTIHANGSPSGDNVKGGGVIVTNAGDVAFHAYNASLECNCAEAYFTGHNEEGLGFGFCAEAGGMLICEYAKAASNVKAGFYALSNGTTWAHGIDSTKNMYGVLAWGGTVECNTLGKFSSTIYNNTSHGVYSTYKGFIGANKALVSGNGGHGFYATSNATIDITVTASSGNSGDGYCVSVNGLLQGDAATSSTNTGNGYTSLSGGTISGQNLTATGNTGWGFIAKTAGRMFAPKLGGTDNKLGFASPVQSSTQDNFTVGNIGSYIIDSV